MAHKINPKLFRTGITKGWHSNWFVGRGQTPAILEEDFKIRSFLLKKLKNAGLEKVNIDRFGENIKVAIAAAKPGVIIGRGGKGIEEIKKALDKIITDFRKTVSAGKTQTDFSLSIDIDEIKNPTASAAVIASMLVEDLEKRMPYRRAMKRAIEQASKNREVKGIKIRVSGRLDGADIARSESLDWGKMPLQTLRADIDYFPTTAIDPFGTIGIKVWVYKGEIFDKEKDGQDSKIGEILSPTTAPR